LRSLLGTPGQTLFGNKKEKSMADHQVSGGAATAQAAKQNNDFEGIFKLLAIGDSSVGKTSLIHRYTQDTFAPKLMATVGIDFKLKVASIDNLKYKLQFWDTAGQEKFKAIASSFFRDAMGVFLVYDITRKQTFDGVQTWAERVKESAPDTCVRILLGNKCDDESHREVSKKEGEDLAKKFGIKFFEVSAKDNICVNEAFMTLATDVKAVVSSSEPSKAGGSVVPTATSTVNPGRSEGNSGSEKSGCC